MNDAAQQPVQAPVSATSRLLRGALSVLAIVMCALALGAVLALLSLFIGVRPCWPMLLGAPLLIMVLRGTGSLQGRFAPVAAVLAVVLASVYAECLAAVARVAAVTSATFAESLRLGGVALALQVAKLGLSPLSVLVYAAAAVIGAWMVRAGIGAQHPERL